MSLSGYLFHSVNNCFFCEKETATCTFRFLPLSPLKIPERQRTFETITLLLAVGNMLCYDVSNINAVVASFRRVRADANELMEQLSDSVIFNNATSLNVSQWL